jgi:Zn-dependent protease/predicted transcriptional regulator
VASTCHGFTVHPGGELAYHGALEVSIMAWSITIGRIAGTAIRIHITFFMLIAWIAIYDYQQGGAAAAWSATLFIVLIFACVVAHEFGHILTARAFGVKTPDVTLLPIGGIASMERIPEEPRQELLIAIAGPLVNVAIAAVLILADGLAMGDLSAADLERASLLQRLATANVALFLFNLVPAFPMDGGRVLRALLAMRYGAERSTAIAARLGQVFAFLFVVAGLFANPLLILIGMFIYFAASSEQQASAFRGFAHDLKVAQGMERVVQSLSASALLPEAVEALLGTAQRIFPVVDAGNRPVGLLDRDELLRALKAGDNALTVSSIMREPALLRDDQSLESAVSDMSRQGLKAQIVVDATGRMVGLLTLENVAEMMMIHAARPDWKFARPASR